MITQNWDKVLEALQLHEILEKDMPRLLYECLLNRKRWQERTINFLREVKANNIRLEQLLKEH